MSLAEFPPSSFTESIYVISILMVAFSMAYPSYKEAVRVFTDSENGIAALTVLFFLAGVGAAYPFVFPLVTYFLFIISIFVSFFSGFETTHLTKNSKINLMLFTFSIIMSVLALILSAISQIVYIVNGGIYLIGMVQGTKEHIMEIARGICDEESYPRNFAIIFMTLCILTIYLPFFGLKLPEHLKRLQFLSDIFFLVGGILAAILKKIFYLLT